MGWLKEGEGVAEAVARNMVCQGCHGDRAKHWSADCWILQCCVDQRGLGHCHECAEFPCVRLVGWSEQNASYGRALERLRQLHGGQARRLDVMIPDTVLAWLLEESEPSVRYRALRELLDRLQNDPEVLAAKAQIPASEPVRKLFAKMHPDGYWLYQGKGAGVDYRWPNSTHLTLGYLAELGMDRSDERIARAVDRYLTLPPVAQDRPRWEHPPDYRNHQSCLYAYNLRSFVMLGYRDDPRIEERVQVLLSDTRWDGGYLCDRDSFSPRTKSCIRGSTKALSCFAALPELWGTRRCQQVVEYFLRRRVLYRMSPPDQLIRDELVRLQFPFLFWGNLLEPLHALSRMGYGKHPALADAWERLASKRDAEGRYPLEEQHSAAWVKSGKVGEPNKWTTLYAYMALKDAASVDTSRQAGAPTIAGEG